MMITIHVKHIQERKTFDVQVEPTQSVDVLKDAIAAQSGLEQSTQHLVFKGKPLRSDKPLAQQVQKGDTVHLVLKQKSNINLHVRFMSGKTIDLELAPKELVGELLATASVLLALDERPRAVCFEGVRLREATPLDVAGIKDGSLLHVILVPQPHLPSLYNAEADRVRVYGLAGSLYARCGGIFGVAAFVDRCMDAWMADPVLNANEAVATWHERAQRCGFKFLVTQLISYQCGGPQVYTGRDMATSHKHLNISEEEWAAFMATLASTCDGVGLSGEDMADLFVVISSMRTECVLAPGERPPRNPGNKATAKPTDTKATLYARLGGVYPIALFCDRLIDALLSDRTVKIPQDSKRTSAALKYLFTELVANKCGGLETLTGNGFEETRLLTSSKELFQLLRCAEAATDHIMHQPLRTALIQCVYAASDLILDPARTEHEDPHGYVDAIAHIAKETTVPMAYIPGGGAVFFAGRDQHFGSASPEQLAACWERLQRLGFRRQRVPQVKSVNEVAGGALTEAAVKSRQASASSFIAAQQRVYGDMRTLYGRVGGVFGLAKLADRLMDSWMKNPTLNANKAVAPWTQSGQAQGFKFLVTQVCGYLTGGPQRYTGQPMDVAHKHLGITAAEWDAFMKDAALTMDALHVNKEMHAELGEIFASFREQCIIEPGERVPPDPKRCRKPPDGTSTYAQVGGVYPLATFADTLVELALAQPKELTLRWEDVKKPGATRHPPGLKYVLTELLCHAAGGPEVLTVRGFDDAKLGVLPTQWDVFMALAQQAAEQVWPGKPVLVGSLEALLEEVKPELCIGVVAEDEVAEGARKLLREAGFSHVQTTAALLECGGDGPKALELLKGGFTLPPPDTLDMTRCPFNRKPARPLKFKNNDALMSPGYPTTLTDARLETMKKCAEAAQRAYPPPFVDAPYEGPTSTPLGDRALERGRWANKNYTPSPHENDAEPLEAPGFPTHEELVAEVGGPEGLFTICGCHYKGMFSNPRMSVLFDARHEDSNVSAMNHGKRIAAVFLDRWYGFHTRNELDRGWYASLGRPHKTLIQSVAASHNVAKKCPMRPKAQQVNTPAGMKEGHPLSNRRFTIDQRDSWVGHVMCAAEECGTSVAFQEKLGLWLAAAVSQYAGFYDEKTGRMDWMQEPPYGEYVDISEGRQVDGVAAALSPAPKNPKPVKQSGKSGALSEEKASQVRLMASMGLGAEIISHVMHLGLSKVQHSLAGVMLAQPPTKQLPRAGAAAVDVSDPHQSAPIGIFRDNSADGKCPFGFDRKKGNVSVQTNPAALIETLRERFSAHLGKADGHVAGRVLSNEMQRALDDLLVEPADLCCPITLLLLADPVIATDGVVYERAAIRVLIEQGKLSPLTFSKLEPELVPATKMKAKVLGFMLARTAALLTFADAHGSCLVVPESARSGGLKNLSLLEIKEQIKGELGLDGTMKEIIEEAAGQLGVETAGKKLVDIGLACLDALGLGGWQTGGAADGTGAGGVTKLAKWESRLAAPTMTDKKEHEEFETRKMVSNALDRAQLYLSRLIAAGGEADFHLLAEVKKLAADFHSLAAAMERPMSVDVLALAAPSSEVELRLRMMTGHEVTVLVPAMSTVAKIVDAAVSDTGAAVDKGHVLVHEGKPLTPSSTLAQHNVVEGTLLTLILSPQARADPPIKAPSVAQLLAGVGTQAAEDGEVRAYGARKGGSVLSALKGTQVKSLYARCGGIFGVAAFADRCMDAWMADAVLNANEAVATWHERAQRCGFKFLVTQLISYQCGGPQVYTGRDMATSHKHLNISEEEWAAFVDGLHDVCSELGLPQQEVDDVTAVVISMRDDCIIQDGETVPDNPGKTVPPGDSLYARAGGLYPLALMCDRLIDALLSDTSVQIKVDGERTMASLKYLFTELVCVLAGGPETMTASSVAATRLQVNEQDFFKLLYSVASSADHLAPPTLAVELAQLLYDSAELILKEPIKWDAPVMPSTKVPTHQEMRRLLKAISEQVKTPLLYVPNGKAGSLLALEHGVPDAAKAQRRKLTTPLGFEEFDGMAGVALIPPATDKDMLLLIDTSGSMQGKRINGATDNALKIYKEFTDQNDHVGLIHFHGRSIVKLPLQRRGIGRPTDPQIIAIENTRRPEWGGTAFYDALIKAVSTPPKSSNSYLIALTDGADMDSKAKLEEAQKVIANSPWTIFVIGLEVRGSVKVRCEALANASTGGMYMHAGDAGSDLDAAFAKVAAQFVMPKVKSADAAASGGGARGV